MLITWDAGSCRKLQTKWFTMTVNVLFSLIHFWTLLPWWIIYTSADLRLFVLLSTALVKSTTMWSHHSHNIFGLPLFLWHCTFPYSINFFNGWFRLHVHNNLFCLFNKVPDLSTAMDWFVVCSVHDTQHISRYHLFSDAFMRFSLFLSRVHVCFHVHVAVENMHVHNALLNFVICCLP